MFDRTGRKTIGNPGTGSRGRSRAGRGLAIEPLEGRALMTATIRPIADITVPQFTGYQVPIVAGTPDNQTFTVTSDTPGVKASVARGQFFTVGVTHVGGAGDPTINGTMTFQLFEDLTPNTTRIIESLVNGTATNLSAQAAPQAGKDYYVGKDFHRISAGFPGPNDFIVQGGSLNGNGTGNAFATPFDDEFNQSLAFTGTGQLAMANAGSDTNDSQFFITTGSPRFLDYHHTIFGQIVAGQDVLQRLTSVKKGADGTTPVSPVTITQATLSGANPGGVIHIDTTAAPITAAHITVTATDVIDRTTTSRTFLATVAPLAPNAMERPFLGPVDSVQTVARGQVDTFQLSSVESQPGAQVTYTVQGGTTTSSPTTGGAPVTTFTPVQHGTAAVSPTGLVTVTPTPGYTGPISLLVGVRDQNDRSGTGTLNTPSNYDTQKITLNVTAATAPVPLRPLAQQVNVTASSNTGTAAVAPTTIQLLGSNPNASPAGTAPRPVAYTLLTQPANGTISGFNAAAGTLNYTPNPGYLGPDSFQYVVNDPGSGLSSFPATVRITAAEASTGAVRFIADDDSNSTTTPGILVVTPLPRTDGGTNVIGLDSVGGNVRVTVNGTVDAIQPAEANVDRIVVYGSKAADRITVDPALGLTATLDGGHGGRNVLSAGGGPTRQHGWFGQNTLKEGSSNNYLLGRKGHVTFVKGSGTGDVLFQGTPTRFTGHSKVRHLPNPTSGTYYAFRGNRLVTTTSPYTPVKTTGNTPKTSTTTTDTFTRSEGTNGNVPTVRISAVHKPTGKA